MWLVGILKAVLRAFKLSFVLALLRAPPVKPTDLELGNL